MNEIRGYEVKEDATRYVSVDVEAAGSNPSDYSLLSIGACLVTNPLVKFYVEIRPLNEKVEEWPAKNLPDLLARCLLEGLPPKSAMEKFARWLEEKVKGKPIFVGFNAVFDYKFVDWYFLHFLGFNPFGINALDIKAYYAGKFGKMWNETNKKKMKAVLGVTTPHTHNALEDAVEQAEIFRRVLTV